MNGKTYSLRDGSGSSEGYYQLVARLADRLLEGGCTPAGLRDRIRRASRMPSLAAFFLPRHERATMRALDESLAPYTEGAPHRLGALGVKGVTDPILRTSRSGHHLYMLEIELTNRINHQAFASAPWRMALFAHCLRDFQGSCAATPGEVEEVCGGCRADCLLRLGSELAHRHGVHPFIAATMDHDRLFRGLASRHPGMAVMGIACVPELALGMRLVESLGIPAVGVPLDANRCARWCGEAGETAFSLAEAERLMRDQG